MTFVNWRGFFAAPGLPEDKANMYRKALAAMYATPEWKAVRDRNGWVDIHNSGKDFVAFLENQEKVIKTLMQQLGFPEVTRPEISRGARSRAPRPCLAGSAKGRSRSGLHDPRTRHRP